MKNKHTDRCTDDACYDDEPTHTPTPPMGWVTQVMHEKTRTLEEVSHFAGPNAGRVLRAVNCHEELVKMLKTVYREGAGRHYEAISALIDKVEGE